MNFHWKLFRNPVNAVVAFGMAAQGMAVGSIAWAASEVSSTADAPAPAETVGGGEEKSAAVPAVHAVPPPTAPSPTAPSPTAPSEALPLTAFFDRYFGLKSPDGAHELRFRLTLQLDGRVPIDDGGAGNRAGLVGKRIHLGLEGRVARYFEFTVRPALGDEGAFSLMDAFLNIRPLTEFQLRIGKQKSPMGLERLQSAAATAFIELGLPTALVPNRDYGATVWGEAWDKALTYQLGFFNGAPDGGSLDLDLDDGKELVARLFAHPFRPWGTPGSRNFGIGLAFSHAWVKGATPTSLRIPSRTSVFSYHTATLAEANGRGTTFEGTRWRIVPQMYGYFGPFSFLGEFVFLQTQARRASKAAVKDAQGNETAPALPAENGTLRHWAWTFMITGVLTGETTAYDGINPDRPVGTAGGLGAVELVARAGMFQADKATFPTFANAGRAVSRIVHWSAGLNYYPVREVKFAIHYEHAVFEGGRSVAGADDNARVADRKPDIALLARLQLAF